MSGGRLRLDPIAETNVRAVFDLEVAPEQRRLVAPNPWSLAQALAQPATTWPRAIVVNDQVVGFLMLAIDPDRKDGRPYWLWRLMVGQQHQRRGYGREALTWVAEEIRSRRGTEIFTRWVPGDHSPEPFYLGLGFEPTGEVDDGEIIARLSVL